MNLVAWHSIGQLMTMASAPVPFSGRSGPITEDSLGIIPNGCVIFDTKTGRIVTVGDTSELKGEIAQCEQKVSLSNQMVSPGFVDCHTHPGFVEIRTKEFDLRNAGATYQEIAQQGGGIKSSVKSVRECSDYQSKVDRNINQMVKCGTTAFEAKSGYGLSIESELSQLKAFLSASTKLNLTYSPTLLAAHSCCPSYGQNVDAYFEEVVLPCVAAAQELHLMDAVDIFVEEGYFSAEHATRLMAEIMELKIDLRMHVDQFADRGGAELAVNLGAISADHLEYTGADGIQSLWEGETFPVCLPISVLSLGKTRYAAANDMFDFGLPVCIATDYNPGSSPCPNMAAVMHVSATMMHLSSAECWISSIWNPSFNLRKNDIVGSISPGKRADLLVWDTLDYREPVVHLGAPMLKKVVVAGKEFA